MSELILNTTDPTAPGRTRPSASAVLIPLACIVIIVAGMRAAASIVVPFLLAAFLSAICAPMVFTLRKWRVPAGLAVFLVILLLLAAFILTGILVGSSVDQFTERMPGYQAGLQDRVHGLTEYIRNHGWKIPPSFLAEYMNPGIVMRLIGGAVTGMAAMLTNAVFLLLTVVFMLLELSILPLKLKAVMKSPEASLKRLSDFMDSFNRYLGIKTATSAATGIAAWICCWLLGVDFPVLWGLMAFLLNYVPTIGSIIAAVPPILLATVQFGFGRALGVTAGYLAINMIIGNVIETRVMGRGLGLSTLIVFMSLVVWGWVFGPVGMLLSVPLTMIIKIALESYEDTRSLAILLDSEAPADSGE
jgi:AI-2 transport protein TqsA